MYDTLFTYTGPILTKTSTDFALTTHVTLTTLQHPISYLPQVIEIMRERMSEIANQRFPGEPDPKPHFALTDKAHGYNDFYLILGRRPKHVLKERVIKGIIISDLYDGHFLPKEFCLQMFFRYPPPLIGPSK